MNLSLDVFFHLIHSLLCQLYCFFRSSKAWCTCVFLSGCLKGNEELKQIPTTLLFKFSLLNSAALSTLVSRIGSSGEFLSVLSLSSDWFELETMWVYPEILHNGSHTHSERERERDTHTNRHTRTQNNNKRLLCFQALVRCLFHIMANIRCLIFTSVAVFVMQSYVIAATTVATNVIL